MFCVMALELFQQLLCNKRRPCSLLFSSHMYKEAPAILQQFISANEKRRSGISNERISSTLLFSWFFPKAQCSHPSPYDTFHPARLTISHQCSRLASTSGSLYTPSAPFQVYKIQRHNESHFPRKTYSTSDLQQTNDVIWRGLQGTRVVKSTGAVLPCHCNATTIDFHKHCMTQILFSNVLSPVHDIFSTKSSFICATPLWLFPKQQFFLQWWNKGQDVLPSLPPPRTFLYASGAQVITFTRNWFLKIHRGCFLDNSFKRSDANIWCNMGPLITCP